MTPKERREKLFNGTKPHIRPLEENDIKWLYGGYKYPDPPGDQEDFAQYVEKLRGDFEGYNTIFVADDVNAGS